MLYDATAFRIKDESPFAHKMNKYGDSGSPCLIPLEGVTNPLGSPLTITE